MAQVYPESSIDEMLNSERLMVLEAHERFPDYYPHAEEAAHFLSTFVKSIGRKHWIFASFLSLIKKHAMLALFSTVRLHRVQAMMDLRQVIESASNAAYALVHPCEAHFLEMGDDKVLRSPRGLAKKRYEWLEANFPRKSSSLKAQKNLINEHAAHSSLIITSDNIEINPSDFRAPFFDIEDDHLVKTDLWLIGNISVGIIELFYLISREIPSIVFVDDLIPRLNKLQEKTETLRAEMMNSDRYLQVQPPPAQ